MKVMNNNVIRNLLVFVTPMLFLSILDMVLAIEPIATIGKPPPLQNAYFDNDTTVRVSRKHIQLVDANTGEIIDEIGNLDLPYYSTVVISPNASQIAIEYSLGDPRRYKVDIWDVNSRELIIEWEFEESYAVAAFSPTQPILVMSNDGVFSLWNWQTGELIGEMEGKRRRWEYCSSRKDSNGKLVKSTCSSPQRELDVEFTQDGKHFVVASQRPDIELWNVETRELVGHFGKHGGSWVYDVAVSPDGAYIASYDSEFTSLYLWNMTSGQLIWKVHSASGTISKIEFSPDSQRLYVASGTRGIGRNSTDPLVGWDGWDENVRVWDVKSGKQTDMFSTGFKSLLNMVISPDGKMLLLSYLDGEVLWDIGKKQIHQAWTDFIHEWSYFDDNVKLSPDGKTVLAMSNHFIKSWDVASEEMRLLIPANDHIHNAIAFSPDSQKFAIGKEPLLEIRDVQSGKVETQFRHYFRLPEYITYSPSGRWVAVKGHWGDVSILDVNSPEHIQRLEPPFRLGTPGNHYPIGFSENGVYFTTSGYTRPDDNTNVYWILLWKRIEDIYVFQYAWSGGFVGQPIFMTDVDGSTVLAGNGEEGIHIWKLLDDEPMLLSTFDSQYALRFSEDRSFLYAFSDNEFQIWDWMRGKLLSKSKFPRFASLSQDGTLLLTKNPQREYELWDLTTLLSSHPHSVDPKGKQLVTLGQLKRNQLMQNFPNPFNPETWIPFQLAEESHVTINIFNPTGEIIRTLSLGKMSAGDYSTHTKAAHWDGKNDDGETVSSGIYFYNIKAGEFSATRRMLIQK